MAIIKKRHTAILTFVVIKPTHELETKGEELKLSLFGEYCPDNSLRGYSLFELLTRPQNYAIKLIIQKGKIELIEPPISAGTVFENNHV